MASRAREPERPTETRPLTRRQFLADLGSLGIRTAGLHTFARTGLARSGPALAAATGLVTACGTEERVAPTIVPLFSPDRVLTAGRRQRIPLAIIAPGTDDSAVALPDDDQEIVVTITQDGETVEQVPVRGRVVEHDHVGETDPDHQHADLFRYYPLRATLPKPGIYDLIIEVDRTRSQLPVQAFDPTEVAVPLPGDPFPVLSTPTAADPRGVDPLCTRFEPCSFHSRDAAELIGGGRPLALLVATPAYCSTAYCGPVLETLIDATADRADLDTVHVEVYANPAEVDGNIADSRIRTASAVDRLGLAFEPSLFLVSGNGVLVDRIDNVFDSTELEEALSRLVP